MKTSQALRLVAGYLDPEGYLKWPGKEVEEASRQFICHIAGAILADREDRTKIRNALVNAGWPGGGVAFYTREAPTGEDIPEEVWRNERAFICTARIVWCLLTAKKHEDMGD